MDYALGVCFASGFLHTDSLIEFLGTPTHCETELSKSDCWLRNCSLAAVFGSTGGIWQLEVLLWWCAKSHTGRRDRFVVRKYLVEIPLTPWWLPWCRLSVMFVLVVVVGWFYSLVSCKTVWLVAFVRREEYGIVAEGRNFIEPKSKFPFQSCLPDCSLNLVLFHSELQCFLFGFIFDLNHQPSWLLRRQLLLQKYIGLLAAQLD